jgi:hypothetical protein
VRSRALLVLTLLAACSSFEASDPAPELPQRDASVAPDADADAGAIDGADPDTAIDATPSASALYEAAVLLDSPKAYWRFTEPVGSTHLASKVGDYSLLPAPNPPAFARPGLFSGSGGAIEYDASSGQRVETSTVPMLAPGPFAVEAWVFLSKPGNDNGRSMIVHSSGQASYFAYLQASTVVLEVSIQNAKRQIVGTGVTDNAWHHLVLQASSVATAEVYVDGIKAVTALNLAEDPYNLRAFILGASDPNSQTIGPGTKLAEVALYDHVLTAQRITEHNVLGKVP